MGNNAELLHDLRMPLQLIYSCAQLLENEIRGNESAMSYLHMLMSSASELQRMVADTLEQSRPGAVGVHFVRGDMVSRVWEVYVRCQLQAERRGVEMSFHSNTDRLEMALDEEKVLRILLNLVSNALKFTPPGGHIRLIVQAMGDYVEVCVADDGCGIAPGRLESIFELHESDDGYGYGLYIARGYARLMGGEVSVESGSGRGSAFTLRLPVHSVEAAGMQANSVGNAC